ncbi:MAG TPA: hypothetical protein VJR89_27655 [Polyangiales bacterium]|nr:hypothetical protein [Polyangiales bacterium]
MNCLVCSATWADGEHGSVCPHCNYDAAADGARDPARIQAARQAFRDRTTAFAPETRVKRWDRLQPWAALAIGFVIFVLWLRACSSGGFRVW